MKKQIQTTVRWQFPITVVPTHTDERIWVKETESKQVVLSSLVIESHLRQHPAGRCVSVVVNVDNGNSLFRGEEARTHELLRVDFTGISDEHQRENQRKLGYLKIGSTIFTDIVGHDGRAYSVQWLLKKNEEFLDGAVRIGCEILERLEAIGHYKHFRRKWMLGNFTVDQKTFVEIKDKKVKGDLAGTDWQPIECWLRYNHGLQE